MNRHLPGSYQPVARYDGDYLYTPDAPPITGVTRDATSNIYLPANSTEWTAFRTAKSLTTWANPSHVYTFQEASGNVLDTVGAINLGPANVPVYNEAVTGWTRKGVRCRHATTDSLSGTGFPNVNADSALVLTLVEIVSAPTTTRNVTILGNSPTVGTRISTTPRLLVDVAGVTAGTGTSSPVGVRLIIDRFNRTTQGRDKLTDQEKIIGSTGITQVGQGIIFGGFGTGAQLSAEVRFLYAATWYGADAERTDAEVKSLLQSMGYSIAWS